MNKKLKIGLSILAFGMTATAGYLIYKKMKNKKANKLISNAIPEIRKKEIELNPTSVTNPPKVEEIKAVVENTPYTMILTNKEDGDAFRTWVNKYYPDYAKSINLDKTGSYNNSYVAKAWAKYGTEYSQSNSRALTLVSRLVNKGASKIVDAGDNFFSPIATKIFGAKEVLSNTGFNAENSALNLYNSMKGWGTNEKLFFKTLESLNKIDRNETIKYYNENYTNLEAMVQSEFGGSELKRALDLIQ